MIKNLLKLTLLYSFTTTPAHINQSTQPVDTESTGPFLWESISLESSLGTKQELCTQIIILIENYELTGTKRPIKYIYPVIDEPSASICLSSSSNSLHNSASSVGKEPVRFKFIPLGINPAQQANTQT